MEHLSMADFFSLNVLIILTAKVIETMSGWFWNNREQFLYQEIIELKIEKPNKLRSVRKKTKRPSLKF